MKLRPNVEDCCPCGWPKPPPPNAGCCGWPKPGDCAAAPPKPPKPALGAAAAPPKPPPGDAPPKPEAWPNAGEAAANGHTECVRLLVEAGADVEARDNEGKTPAEHAAESMPVRHAVLEVLGQS